MPLLKSPNQKDNFAPIKKEGKPSLPMALSVARKNRAKGVPAPAHSSELEHTIAAMGEHPKSLVEAIREKRKMAQGGEVEEPKDEDDDLADLNEEAADEEEPKTLVDRIRAKRRQGL